MAFPAITYTFANSTASDAAQLNQNFSDLLTGITAGTKDINVSAGAFAGIISAAQGVVFSGTPGFVAGGITYSASTGLTSFAKAGSSYDWSVIDAGNTTAVLRIPTGTTTVAFAGTITGFDATDSTTSTTGALTLAGGLGVAKAVNIGTTLGVTGAATFSSTATVSGGNILANLSSASAVTIQVNNNNAGVASQSQMRLQTDSSHAAGSMRMIHVGPSSTTNLLGSFTGEQAVIETDANFPLLIGTNGTERLRIQGDGTLRLGAITASTVPSNTTSAMGMYQTGTKFVLWYNDAGTMRYKYLDMSGTGVTWVHTTTAP